MGKKYHYNTGIYEFNGGGAQKAKGVTFWSLLSLKVALSKELYF